MDLKKYFVICEGETEKFYCDRLSRFLKNKKILFKVIYIAKSFYNFESKEKEIRKKINETKKDKPECFLFLLDYDVIQKKEKDKEKYKESIENRYNNLYEKRVKFLYSYENFEDFLISHLDEEKYNDWQKICKNENHFQIPMDREKVKELINQYNIFQENYDKSFLPSEIEINKETLNRIKERKRSDLVDFIFKELE